MSEGWRRDFAAETAARARGDRPRGCGTLGGTTASTVEVPEGRIIVIPKSPRILDKLLAASCAIKPVGEDWHIRCRSRSETERIVAMCKLNRIHGIIRVPRGGMR